MKNLFGQTVNPKTYKGRIASAPLPTASNPGNYEPKTLAAITDRGLPQIINRAETGRVIRVPIIGVPNPTLSSMIVPFTIPAKGANSFYIIDSPVPLRMKSDIFSDALYAAQMGDCFEGPMGSLTIDGIGFNPGILGTTENIPFTTTGSILFVARIWVGTTKTPGIIDHRTLPSTTWKERLVIAPQNSQTIGSGTLALGNNFPAGALTQFYLTGSPNYGPSQLPFFQVVKEWLITNLDSSNTVYATDGNSAPANALCAIFPQSTVRIPTIGNFNGNGYDNFNEGFIQIANLAASNVTGIVAAIVHTTSQEFDSQ